MKHLALISALAGAAALAACATPTAPVEVTRFVAPETVSRLGQGTISIERAPELGNGQVTNFLATQAIEQAVARELVRQGYTIAPAGSGAQVAQIQSETAIYQPGQQRGPVSVGVGGSTGTYGSGVGLGIGIDLSGKPKAISETRVHVMIRDRATQQSLWEGRANAAVRENLPLARDQAGADRVASALFRNFPGTNGETIEVK